MNGREHFRLSHLFLSLILLCSRTQAGDFVVSLVKGAGKWALENAGKVAGAAIAGKTINYTSKSYDPMTGTFDLSGGRSDITSTITENRGLSTGLQTPSSSYTEPAVIDPNTGRPASRRVSENILHDQYVEWRNNKVKDEAKTVTIKQLDEKIREHEQFLVKDRKEFAKNKNRDSSWNEVAAQHENDLATLKAEKAARKPKLDSFAHLMTDEDLDKNIRNFTEKLEDAKAVYEEASKPEWWGKKREARVEKGQVDTISNMLNRFKAEKESRVQAKVIHTVSTTMVMTSQTGGVVNSGTKMEKVPEKEKELPVYKPEIVDKVPKVISTELTSGGKGPDKDPENEKINKIVVAATVGTATEEALRKTLEPTPPATHDQQAISDREARKAERALMNNDTQPFHEKGIEAKFPDNPGQKDHQFDLRAGHIAERTPNAEIVVKDTIKAEHFDWVDKHGNSRYTREFKGKQVWVEVRPDGTIKNCGANETFWVKNELIKRYIAPPGAENDKGVFFSTLGAGALGATMREINATQDPATARMINKLYERINKQTGLNLSPNSPLRVPMTPELESYGEYKAKEFMNMTPQQQMESILKPQPTIIKPITLSGGNPLPSGTSASQDPASAKLIVDVQKHTDSPLKIPMTPELKAYGEYKAKEFKNMTPQQQIESIMKPQPSILKPMTLPGGKPLPSGTSVFTQPVVKSIPTPTVSSPPAPKQTLTVPTVGRPSSSTRSSSFTVTNGSPRSMPTPPPSRPSISSSSSSHGFTKTASTSSSGKTTTTWSKKF